MASCKSGKPGALVAPAEPKEAQEADNADPVEASKIKVKEKETKTGKYGKQEVKPFKPEESKPGEEKEKDWIEIVLKDKDTGEPIAGEYYECSMPDGSVQSGTLDQKGFARIEGVDPGTCNVTFPRQHEKNWDKKG